MATESHPTKLTLRLDGALIERAKIYARKRGTSISQMVADYFQALTQEEEAPVMSEESWKKELGPRTSALLGLLEGSTLDEAAYRQHLEEKHLGAPDKGAAP